MLSNLYTILTGITGFSKKVAYRCFPVGEAPALPYICYEVDGSRNVIGDNEVIKEILDVNIDLYSKQKDTTSEGLIETALKTAKIPWNKTETYIDTEDCFMVTYSITLI